MLVYLQSFRKMATVASFSKLIITSGVLQASASPAQGITSCRPLVSVRSVSARLSSPSLVLGVGNCGAHQFYSAGTLSRSKRMATSASSEPKADSRQYFALTYDYVPDILEKRVPHRPGHIALAQAEEAEGKLLLGGAWGAPVDGALFLWLVHSADEVQQFVNKDPYVTAGLVTKFDIRPLAAAVGSWVTAAKVKGL